MSQVTELATAQLTSTETITIELIEADQTPAVVIVRWPSKPSVFHSRRFTDTAAAAANCSLRQQHGWQQSSGSVGCRPPVLERFRHEVLNNDRTTVHCIFASGDAALRHPDRRLAEPWTGQ